MIIASLRLLISFAAFALPVAQAQAQTQMAIEPAVQRGRTLAKEHCAKCHAIEKFGSSPITEAQPLRDLQARYPVEDLTKPLHEGIIARHPSMPVWRFDADQVNDLIAFMKSVQTPRN